MESHGHEFISSPKIEYVADDSGRVHSAYFRIRTGAAIKAVQPNPQALVYFYLADDGLPVGIHMLEPRPGIALSGIFTSLVEDGDGSPEGIGEQCHHAYLPFDEKSKLLKALLDALGEVEDRLAPAEA